MIPKKLHNISGLVALGLALLLLSGCSTKKNTWTRRAYHNVTCRDNVYWNGNNSLNEGMTNLQENIAENYNRVLRVYNYGEKADAQKTYPKMDRTIKKASIAPDFVLMDRIRHGTKGLIKKGLEQIQALLVARIRGDPNRTEATSPSFTISFIVPHPLRPCLERTWARYSP